MTPMKEMGTRMLRDDAMLVSSPVDRLGRIENVPN